MAELTGGKLGDLKARAETAIEQFEKGREKLFQADGKTKIFSDTEHEERLRALRGERNRILREVEEEAGGEISSAQADLTALENGDPTTLLTSEELEQANVRRTFILDDVTSLTQEEELINRLEAVLHGGARDSMFAYLQAGRQRARELREVSPALGAALEKLGEKLVSDSRRAELEAARKRIEGAGEVRDLVWLARREQSSFYAPQYNVPGR